MNEPKWKDTFHYTQSERRGIFVLAFLLVAFLVAKSFLSQFHQPTPTDFTAYKKAIDAFEKERVIAQPTIIEPFLFNPNTASKAELIQLGIASDVAQRIINFRQKGGRFYKKEDLKKIYRLSPMVYEQLTPFIEIPQQKVSTTPPTIRREGPKLYPFPFDPNTISKAELLKIGLSKQLTKQWINYRQKGGKFYKNEDVAKLYALSPSEYEQLLPFITIKQEKITVKKTKKIPLISKKSNQTNTIKIDVNTAGVGDWQKLKGVGPYYAKKIIRFREKLGGFASIQQIGNTYGLPDSVFQQIKPQLILSPILNPIAINLATIEDLSGHPYIQRKQAKVIVNYRKNHGPFHQSEDLKKVRVLSDQEIERIKPYLSFQQ